MTKRTWKTRIKKSCEDAGTYRDYFENVIDTLASILEKRDAAEEQYEKTGSHPMVMYTNKGGATNMVENPLLSLWDNLNKSALAYWRELGLTPAGLKRIDDTAMKKKKVNGLAAALRELGG